jgi:putative endonuclease
MTTEKQDIGKIGEDIAVKYLQNHGFKVIERNYRKPWGEIDIIASDTIQKPSELVFVEVKSQKEGYEWRPEENVTFHKKHQLSRIILTYLKEKRISEDQDWRIDVLGINLDFKTSNARIEHIKNIILN